MGREDTLLERIRNGESPSSRTAVEDSNRLIRSIQRNVARILNARVGHALAQPDYGVPAPSEIVYSFPSAIHRMQRHIRDVLGKYEPRLSEVEVIHVESEDQENLTLQFQVQARLTASATTSWVSFLTRMDPSGRISLRR